MQEQIAIFSNLFLSIPIYIFIDIHSDRFCHFEPCINPSNSEQYKKDFFLFSPLSLCLYITQHTQHSTGFPPYDTSKSILLNSVHNMDTQIISIYCVICNTCVLSLEMYYQQDYFKSVLLFCSASMHFASSLSMVRKFQT